MIFIHLVVIFSSECVYMCVCVCVCVFDLFMCIPLETGKHFIFGVSQYVSQIFTSWYVLSSKKNVKRGSVSGLLSLWKSG